MAKKSKKHHPPRRRVGNAGGGKGIIQTIMGLGIGSVAAKVVHNSLGGMNPKISSGLMAVGGAFLADHFKSPILKGAALGVCAVGTSELLTEFGVVHGVGAAIIDMLPENSTAKQVVSGPVSHQHRLKNQFRQARQPGQVVSGKEDLDAVDEMVHNDQKFHDVLY